MDSQIYACSVFYSRRHPRKSSQSPVYFYKALITCPRTAVVMHRAIPFVASTTVSKDHSGRPCLSVLACSCHKVTTCRVIPASHSTKSRNQLRLVLRELLQERWKTRAILLVTGIFMPSSQDNRMAFSKMILAGITVVIT